MDINKFNNISDMLINKLNEDFSRYNDSTDTELSTLLEAVSNDGLDKNDPTDSKDALTKTLRASKKKAEFEHSEDVQKHKQLINARDNGIVDPDIVKKQKMVSDSSNIKFHDADQKNRKNNYLNSINNLTEEEITDEDIYYLAEEFEKDLNEAAENETQDPGLKRIELEKERTAKKLADAKEDAATAKTENDEEFSNKSQAAKNEIDSRVEALEKKAEQAEENLEKEQKQEEMKNKANIEKEQKRLEKLSAAEAVVKNNSFEESFDLDAINEGLKAKVNDMKTKKLAKKLEKVSNKKDNIDKKIDELNYKISIYKQKIEKLSNTKGSEKTRNEKIYKIHAKINALTPKLDALKQQSNGFDKEISNYEFEHDKSVKKGYTLREGVELNEDELIDFYDNLTEEVEKLEAESKDIEKDIEDLENDKDMDPECKKIISQEYTDPMLNKIAKLLKAELNKDEPDKDAIKNLKYQFKKFSSK